ncbi:MAG: hypothetical protein ABW184_05315 [Sphingobium sp.]
MTAEADAERTARIWEGMARVLCELGQADPDFLMWDGQPLWKWRMHGDEAKARIEAAIAVLKGADSQRG